MVTIEQVLEKLKTNENLNSVLIQQITELILMIKKEFASVDLTKLHERIGTFKLIEGSRYVLKDLPAQYNADNNVIAFNCIKTVEKYDITNFMMQQILDMTVVSGSKIDEFKAIRAGYRSILANNLVGNEPKDENLENPYLTEETIINLLIQIVGLEKFKECYCSDNYQPIKIDLYKLYNKPEEINTIINLTRYDFDTKFYPDIPSFLGDIQKILIDIFEEKVKRDNLGVEDIKKFRTNLIGNSVIFEEKREKYKSVDGVYAYFDQKFALKKQMPLLPQENIRKSR